MTLDDLEAIKSDLKLGGTCESILSGIRPSYVGDIRFYVGDIIIGTCVWNDFLNSGRSKYSNFQTESDWVVNWLRIEYK